MKEEIINGKNKEKMKKNKKRESLYGEGEIKMMAKKRKGVSAKKKRILLFHGGTKNYEKSRKRK